MDRYSVLYSNRFAYDVNLILLQGESCMGFSCAHRVIEISLSGTVQTR